MDFSLHGQLLSEEIRRVTEKEGMIKWHYSGLSTGPPKKSTSESPPLVNALFDMAKETL